jgi:hypothetical protein
MESNMKKTSLQSCRDQLSQLASSTCTTAPLTSTSDASAIDPSADEVPGDLDVPIAPMQLAAGQWSLIGYVAQGECVIGIAFRST